MPPLLHSCLRAGASATLRPQLTLLALPTIRTFTTTPSTLYKQPRVPKSKIPIPSVSAPHPEIPPYPLGPRQTYHQSNTGLYGNASIRFGNKVSKRNEVKTRRKWRPNVHHKRLWSESLDVFVRTRVTTRVLRTIDKVGGLDAYLLGIKPARIQELGPWGWRLRWRIMQAPSLRKKLNEEREQLGLPTIPVDVMMPMEGVSAEAAGNMMAETDKMLAGDEEIALGEESGEQEETFMREPNMKLKDLKQ
jgi:large subunit ribosomal protein L28